MKKYVLIYDQIVVGHGLCKAGTVFEAVLENDKYIGVQFDDRIVKFSKLEAVEADNG